MCYECSQYFPIRSIKTPKSFLSNSIDNNLSRKVLYSMFPIVQHSAKPFLRKNICLVLFLESKFKATVFWQRKKLLKRVVKAAKFAKFKLRLFWQRTKSCENCCTTTWFGGQEILKVLQ